MLPTVTFIGTVVADPELRFTPSGKAVCSLRVVANGRKKTEDGSWIDVDATFIPVSAWERLGENIVESVHKGDQVVVVGRMRQREWEDREGQKRREMEIQADTVAVSLQFATATVKKVTRTQGAQGTATAGRPAAADEPPPF